MPGYAHGRTLMLPHSGQPSLVVRPPPGLPAETRDNGGMGDFGCGACYEGEPKVAWDHVSHGQGARPKIAGDYAFEVRVTRCPTCGQAFLFIQNESISSSGRAVSSSSPKAADPAGHGAGTRCLSRWAMIACWASQPSGNFTGTFRWTGSTDGWASRRSGMPLRATTTHAWR